MDEFWTKLGLMKTPLSVPTAKLSIPTFLELSNLGQGLHGA
jgi:hypothetical protein